MTLLLPNHAEPIEITGSGYVAISARDVKRTARFYARLFGFRVVEDRRESCDGRMLLSARGRAFIALHERRDAAAAAAGPPQGCAFVVENLDEVRESLWNQGVVPTGGCMTPQIAPNRCRFLVIQDPDGRDIKLVEEPRSGTPAAGPQVLRSRERAHGARCPPVGA
jgi:catechol 2,3-dioxygenase-like lactoylglutathione lyase family enzyme